MFLLTNKQEEGLKLAVARYKAREPWTCISGYAGSGKSTLVQFIISALNLYPEDVCYVAYTGKAAQVLRQKGCPNPITAHKLLYRARQMPNGSYKFVPRSELENPDYKVIVVDEVSMLPKDMWELLLRHRIHVLALGDPGQLPPIDPNADNHVLDHPHVFLDEIMRQASESEIIRLSMHIREGRPVSEFETSNSEVMILDKSEVNTGVYEWADQILCATNSTRFNINKQLRQIKGFGPEPQEGDKIISLRNQWEFFSDSWVDPSPLTNGTIGIIQSTQYQNINVPKYIFDKPIPVLYTTIIDDNCDKFDYIPIDYTALTTGQKLLTGQQEFQMRKNLKCPEPPFEFAYAYGITCHKAQGSEWKKVLCFEERFPFTAEEHARWLYTAITRASEKLVIVKK